MTHGKVTGPQLLALYGLKGTGLYVGKDALMKTRLMHSSDYRLRTLLALRKKGLIEHSHCSEWYLTREGQEFIRQGRLS
jgi:hypothetical protein